MYRSLSINNRARLNLILGMVAFAISAAGSVLLHIVFATNIYKETGSGLLTSLFISLQYLPAIVVIIFKSDWEDGIDPRKRWLKLELLGAVLTLPILLFVDNPNYYILFIVLFARGIVDHIARTIKSISARYIFPEEKVTQYAPILQAGYHIGIALAAIVGIGTGQHFSLQAVVKLDVASFLVAAGLLYFITTVNHFDKKKAVTESFRIRLTQYRLLLLTDQRLCLSALLPPVSSAIFQGSYSVFLPLFPLVVLRCSANSVAIGYVLTTLAILGGSLFFSYLNNRSNFYTNNYSRTSKIIVGLSCMSAIAYMCTALSDQYLLCATLFSLMVFTYEMVWMFGYTGIFAYAPKGELGSIVSISFAFGYCAGSLCIVLAGALLDYFNGNFFGVVTVFMSVYFLILGSFFVVSKVKRNNTIQTTQIEA